MCKLGVSTLAGVTKEEIRALFSQHVEVKDVILKEHVAGGYAFVNTMSIDGALVARNALAGGFFYAFLVALDCAYRGSLLVPADALLLEPAASAHAQLAARPKSRTEGGARARHQPFKIALLARVAGADVDRAVLGLLLAHDQQVGDLLQAPLADLVADPVVASVDLAAQAGVEQLLRKGLDRLAALGALAHRHEHVLGDGGEEMAEALDHFRVGVARAPQRDRPHLVDVRPQQRAARRSSPAAAWSRR